MLAFKMGKFLGYSTIILIGVCSVIWLARPLPLKVMLGTVKYAPFAQYIEEDAKTRAKKIYTITAPVSGELLRINLEEGDPVTTGELLATIQSGSPALLDSRTKKTLTESLGIAISKKEEAIALAEQAKAALETAQADYKRKKILLDKGYFSVGDFDQVELTYKSKEKAYDAAEKNVQSAIYEVDTINAFLAGTQNADNPSIERVEIRSPITGNILRIQEKSESMVSAGKVLLALADVSKLEVVAEVLSTDAAQIPPKARVIITRWGGTTDLQGIVRMVESGGYTKISALGVEEQRTHVVIDITSSHEIWKRLGDAYRVDVDIITYESPHELVVPMSAVFRDGEQWAVFVVEKGRAHKRVISISRYNPNLAVVAGGLTAGEQVILYPAGLVKENIRVKGT